MLNVELESERLRRQGSSNEKPVVVAQRVGGDSSGGKMRLPSSVLTVAGSEGLLWRE